MTSTDAKTVAPRSQMILIGAGILLTMLPVTLIVTVLKELISLRFSVSLFWAHAFMSTSLFGGILFAPLAGMIVDYMPSRRSVIVIALLINSFCFFVMWQTASFEVMLAARFLEGAAHITALTAWMASGASLGDPSRSGRIMGALGGLLILGITIGVPLGGIIAKSEAANVLWSAGVISAIAALPALGIRGSGLASPSSSFRDYLKTLQQTPWLLLPYAYTFIDRLCIGIVISSVTLYMTEILGMDPATRGIELFYFLLPFAILSYPAGRLSDRFGRIWPMAIGTIFFGAVYTMYGYAEGLQFSILMVVSGILCALMFAPNLAMCRDLSSEEQKGSAFAGYNVAGSLGFAVGPLLGGSIYAWLITSNDQLEAFRQTFVIAGSFEILCAIISLPFLIKLYRSGIAR